MPAGPSGQPLIDMAAEALVNLADAGDVDALAELDRRGGSQGRSADPSRSFDIAAEGQPNPAWLAQLAITLRGEGDLLDGHSQAALEMALALPYGPRRSALAHRACEIAHVARLLHTTSRALRLIAEPTAAVRGAGL